MNNDAKGKNDAWGIRNVDKKKHGKDKLDRNSDEGRSVEKGEWE